MPLGAQGYLVTPPHLGILNVSAECAGRDMLGILLTGMGDDGARGMKVLHDGSARTLAQNEATCVVFGLSKEAIKRQAVHEILPLECMGHCAIGLAGLSAILIIAA